MPSPSDIIRQALLAQIANANGSAGPGGGQAYANALTALPPPRGVAQAAPGVRPVDPGNSSIVAPASNPAPQMNNAFPSPPPTRGSSMPAPAQKSSSSGYSGGGGLGDFLGNLVQDVFNPGARDRNLTADWLVREGFDAGTASIMASNPPMLRQYLSQRAANNSPKGRLELQKLGLEVDNLRNPTTDDIKEFTFAQNNGGFNGTFQDWMLSQKRAGATNVSDIGNTKGETSYDQMLGKSLGEKTVSIMDAGMQAPNKIGTLNLMKEALGNVYQGVGGEAYQNLRRLGQSMGFDLSNVGDGDLVRSISRQMALQLRDPSQGGGMPGALSNADRDFLTSMVPGLSKTPAGNAQIIDYMVRLQHRNADIARMAGDYMSRNGGRLDYRFFRSLADWTNANPLFPPLPKGNGNGNGPAGDGGPSRVRNPATPGANAPVRAVNPQTGERIELQNGKWVPVQ